MMGPTSGPDLLCVGSAKADTRGTSDPLRGREGCWMPPIDVMHLFDRRLSAGAER